MTDEEIHDLIDRVRRSRPTCDQCLYLPLETGTHEFMAMHGFQLLADRPSYVRRCVKCKRAVKYRWARNLTFEKVKGLIPTLNPPWEVEALKVVAKHPPQRNYCGAKSIPRRLLKRVEEVAGQLYENKECVHCQRFSHGEYAGVVPSTYGGFVRPCPIHRTPLYPKIAKNVWRARDLLLEQYRRYGMVSCDWDSLEKLLQ